jgi:hypothetical protein
VTRLRQQAALLGYYVDARSIWDDLTDDQRKNAKEEMNPDAIWSNAPHAALERTPSDVRTLAQQLQEAAVELRKTFPTAVPAEPAGVPPAPQPQPAKLKALADAGVAAAKAAPRELKETVVTAAPTETEGIRGAIRLADWGVFVATLLVSAVAYLITLYNGSHFGSVTQYLEAFTAGFGGQVLANVAALPLLRSYAVRAASVLDATKLAA